MTTQKLDFQKIAKHAEANRWNGHAIAKKAGISFTTVYNVLNGKQEPSATNLKAICDTIGLSIEDVFISTEELEAAA